MVGNWSNIKARYLSDLENRDHNVLTNRSAPHAHPASAIDGISVNNPIIPVDVTGIRLIDTVVPGTNIYTNNDPTRTMVVTVGAICENGVSFGGTAVASFNIQADTNAIPSTLVSPTVGSKIEASNHDTFMTVGFVLPGYNYRVAQIVAGTGTVTLNKWFETYI